MTVPQTLVDRFTDLERRLRALERGGWGATALHHNWRAEAGSVVVTSGSFTVAYRSRIYTPAAGVVTVTVNTLQGATTTGELRLTLEGVGSTTVKTLPINTTTTTVFAWEHGQPIGLGAAQQSWTIEARCTAGASLTVYEPDGLFESGAITPGPGGLVS